MKEYILDIKKIISPKFCNKIIQYFDNEFEEALTVASDKPNKDIRNCQTRSIFKTKTCGELLCLNAIKEKIFQCVDFYKQQHKINIDQISQLDLLKYETNTYKAGYSFHQDFGSKCNERHLSISICLNNEFQGGEFVFDLPSGNYTVPQNIGDAVVFPSNFMFPHQVNKVTKGTRYALIGWVM